MGNFTVKTSTLQNIVNKVSKGAGNSKFSAITSLMNVKVENNQINLTTTDTNNYFTVRDTISSGEPLEFTVNVDTFVKLVSKTSTENIKISVDNDIVTFSGNGNYKIPIQLDVDGSTIKYPTHTINNPEISGVVKTSFIKNVVLHNKPSLAVTLEAPYLVNYLCTKDSGVISADTFNICKNNIRLFDKDILISPTVFDLLSMCNEEDIHYSIYGNNILFESSSIKLFSTLPDGIENYPTETINNIMNTEIESMCVLPKTALLSVLDRLSLFIKDNDENGVFMTFTNSGVKLESVNNDAIETIPYQGSENFKDYTCFVGIESLRKQLNARVGEAVTIYYGDDTIIKMAEDNVSQVISLLDDPRSEM